MASYAKELISCIIPTGVSSNDHEHCIENWNTFNEKSIELTVSAISDKNILLPLIDHIKENYDDGCFIEINHSVWLYDSYTLELIKDSFDTPLSVNELLLMKYGINHFNFV